ncbi:unnamed protein product [Closterium sp. Yama58-4]|nr:unnamed protein product [Closterium sp. Yama58-4]
MSDDELHRDHRLDEEISGKHGAEAAPADAKNVPGAEPCRQWFPSRWRFGWRRPPSIADICAATNATAASESATEATALTIPPTSDVSSSKGGCSGSEGGSQPPPPRPPAGSVARVWLWLWSRRDVLLMSTAFLFFFVAFNALQNVATSIHGASNIGALSMGVLYAVIVVSAPLSPFPIRFWRARAAILVAQTGFWAFIGSNAFTIEWLLLLASCYLGVCWSVVWVAQGVYLVAAAGVYSKRYNKPMDAVVTEFSSLLSWLLRDLKPIEECHVDDATLNSKRCVAALAPCPSISSARSLSIFTVDWEEMEEQAEEEMEVIEEEDESEEEGEDEGTEEDKEEEGECGLHALCGAAAAGAQWMGGAMMVFGVAIAACCFFAVRYAMGLSSIRLMLLLGAASQAAVLVLTWVFQDRPMSEPAAFALVFGCALLWGIGATAFQSQITALLPLVFPSDVVSCHWSSIAL